MTDLAERLADARAKGVEASVLIEDLPSTMDEAYAVARRQIAEVAAWKIGGANPWSRKVFGNTEVFFGPIASDEVHLATKAVSLDGLVAPLAEPEVMLRLGRAGPSGLAFSDMALGFEIPASVLPEDCKATLAGQIADRAGTGLLWISEPEPFDRDALTASFTSVFQHNDTEQTYGGSDSIFGGPLGAAQEFLDLAARYDMPFQPGQWVATGGLSPAVPVRPGDVTRVTALGRSAKLAFV